MLKKQLIDAGIVGFSLTEMQLVLSADDNYRAAANVWLKDDSLPLCRYGIGPDSMITALGGSVSIEFVTGCGEMYYKSFPVTTPMNTVRDDVRWKTSYLLGSSDFWLFLREGNVFKKLDEECKAPIGTIAYDAIYIVKNSYFKRSETVPVYHNDVKVGRVGWGDFENRPDSEIAGPGVVGVPGKECGGDQGWETAAEYCAISQLV